jgi:hypothetical protein
MVTFTNAGLEYDAKLFNGVSTNPFKYVALGSGTTAEADDQTVLVTEITGTGLARAEGTTSYEASYISVITHTFTATGSTTFQEAGLFDDASGGNMAMRHLFSSAKNIDNGEQATITFKATKARV